MDAPELRQKPASREADGVEQSAREAREAVWTVLDEWKAAEPGDGFDAAVMARIRGEERGPASAGWLRGLAAWFRAMDARRGFGLAAAATVLLLAGVLLREPGNIPEAVQSAAAAPEFSAQQVEAALEDLRLLDELYSTPAPDEHQNRKI